MTLTTSLKSSALFLSLGLATMIPVNAAQAAQPGPYIGIGAGSAHDEILNEDESAFKFYGGVNLTPHIGLELGYVDLGSYVNGVLTQDGISYELIGYIPISGNIDLYGRAGFFDWEVATAFASNTGTDTTFGVGIQAQLAHHLSLRGEYQSFLDVDGGDVDLYTASLNLHF